MDALRTEFFRDLAEYGPMVSFEKKRQQLEEKVASLQAQEESLEKILYRLGLPLEEVEEAVKSLVALKKRGIIPSTVVSYYRVLSQSGLQSKVLEKEILELGGLKRGIASRIEENEKLDQEKRNLSRVVGSLRAEETEIKTTIRELKDSGIREVKEVSLAIMEELQTVNRTFLEDLGKWGNLRAEVGRYEEELRLARYFGRLPLSTEAVAVLVEEVSALVVAQYLTIARAWCQKRFNPKLRPPRIIVAKYYRISDYTEVQLADLLTWSLIALTEGGAYGSK